MSKLLVFILAASALASCAKVSSTEVKSGGIWADVHVTGDSAGGAVCEAVFQVGDATGTFLSLDGGDQVTCDGKPMGKTEVLGEITYSVKVPYDLTKTYPIVLSRPGETPYEADVTLPEPVSITWPRAAERVAATGGVELRWALGATTAYDILVTLAGPKAGWTFGPDYPDIGSKLLPKSSLEMPDGSTAENFTATVLRSRAGTFLKRA